MIERPSAIELPVMQSVQEARGEIGRHDAPPSESDRPLEDYGDAKSRTADQTAPGNPIRRIGFNVPLYEPTCAAAKWTNENLRLRSRLAPEILSGADFIRARVNGPCDASCSGGIPSNALAGGPAKTTWRQTANTTAKVRADDFHQHMVGTLVLAFGSGSRRGGGSGIAVAQAIACQSGARILWKAAEQPLISFGGIGPLVETLVNFSRLQQSGGLPAGSLVKHVRL